MGSAETVVTADLSSVEGASSAYEVSKRTVDVTVALGGLVLLAPLWVLVWLAVRLTSAGPVIYRQRRVVGRGGREFTVFKFRTMVHKSDDSHHKRAIARFLRGEPLGEVERNGTMVPVYKLTDDDRITKVGKILRKTGLDEVPQFVNVLRGEMSIVGPRPPLYYEYERYTAKERKRLAVVPGITGWYQVKGRSQVTFDQMVELDLEYIRRRSLWFDLKIMVLTPWVMATGKGGH